MLIDHEREFIFIRVPHTASRAISSALIERAARIDQHGQYHNTILPDSPSYPVYAVHRHPYQRMRRPFAKSIQRGMPFSDFMEWVRSTRNAHMVSSVCEFIGAADCAINWIRYEHIENDRLPDYAGPLAGLQLQGKETRDFPPLTNEYYKLVTDQHIKDFNCFNYEIADYEIKL